MIAVAFALPTESAKSLKLLKSRAIGDADVRVLHTGVGEAATRKAMQQFLRANSPDVVISSGFAGALTDELNAGDLVLAPNFTSPEWLERSRVALPATTRLGVLATHSAIADAPDERINLAARAGAIAVDMETQFIADACRAASIPLVSLRVISDTPAAPLPAPPHVLFDLEAQKTNVRALTLHIARHPSSIVRLIAFARQIAIARARLASALAMLLQGITTAR
jgi:nucleoside phosphorylase